LPRCCRSCPTTSWSFSTRNVDYEPGNMTLDKKHTGWSATAKIVMVTQHRRHDVHSSDLQLLSSRYGCNTQVIERFPFLCSEPWNLSLTRGPMGRSSRSEAAPRVKVSARADSPLSRRVRYTQFRRTIEGNAIVLFAVLTALSMATCRAPNRRTTQVTTDQAVPSARHTSPADGFIATGRDSMAVEDQQRADAALRNEKKTTVDRRQSPLRPPVRRPPQFPRTPRQSAPGN